jgi:hypothetical protein
MSIADLRASDSLPYFPMARGNAKSVRRVQPGWARDEDEQPIALRFYTRCCGTAVWGRFNDFDGAHWKTRIFDGEGEDAELTRVCPGCGSALYRQEDHGEWPHVLTRHEAEQAAARERERLCAGGPFDERTIAALNYEVGEGLAFDDAAALYGRAPDTLRRELEAWLDGGQPQIQE